MMSALQLYSCVESLHVYGKIEINLRSSKVYENCSHSSSKPSNFANALSVPEKKVYRGKSIAILRENLANFLRENSEEDF